ncbi:extracellular solute-binding protein family 5 [Terriglobus saanensis SP1PR4]|uniref:Extracellular solute-binding protein family 5 n=1 Tax=Terriglobus saanensis (strain ATCC BAA-1853 / DSM 23119 / SP1PR4) TaxID=401053 RepID=E8V3G1_TERSS|nr:extracellular solute-binding protein family 5 [Terriglobus saanensis SP1PR4]
MFEAHRSDTPPGVADHLRPAISKVYRWQKKRFVGAVCVGLIALALPADSAGETVLRGRLAADILSLDPGTFRDANTDAVVLHIVEGLVASREDGSLGPMLASRWKISDEGKTYTFTLREGVVFHNGAPFTSDDVLWSLTRYLKPKTHWRCRSDFSQDGMTQILSILTPDPQTVVIRLSKAAPLFLKTLARSDCGGTGILQRNSVGPDGIFRTPIGTGPFQVGVWKRNQYIELDRFPRYASLPGPRDGNCGGKQALVDKVRFLIIPDGSAARVALLRGSLDVLDAVNATELASIKGKPGIRIEMNSEMDFYVLLFQTKDPVLQDVRIRRAIALSIDGIGLTRVVTMGTAQPDSSPVPNVSPFHGPVESAILKQNLDMARRLVKESGYHGQPIQIITNRRYPQNFDSAVLIQAMAARAGINLQIEILDWATQSDRYASGSYQTMAHSFSARLDPSFNFLVLIGDKSKEPRKTWDTPYSKQLLQASMQIEDPAKRQLAIDALQRQFIEDVPAVVLYNSTRIAAVRTNVIGYRGWPADQQRLWSVGFK